MTRPRKYPDGLGSKVSFRLPASAHAQFVANVEASQLSQSDYLRWCVMQRPLPRTTTRVSRTEMAILQVAFRRIGHNLQELVLRLNSEYQSGNASEEIYLAALLELQMIHLYAKAALEDACS